MRHLIGPCAEYGGKLRSKKKPAQGGMMVVDECLLRVASCRTLRLSNSGLGVCFCVGSGRSLISPKVVEPVSGKLSISSCMGNLFMPKVMLDRSSIVAMISQIEPSGVSQHMWMRRER